MPESLTGQQSDSVNAAPHSARYVDVGLAEYNALRAELKDSQTRQANLLSLGLTGISALVGIALARDGSPSSSTLLLIVPPLAFIVSLLHLHESLEIRRIGAYIGGVLWPALQEATGFEPSWEKKHAEDVGKRGSLRGVWPGLLLGGTPFLLCAISIAALWMAHFSTRKEAWVEWAEWLIALSIVLLPLVFGITVLWRHRGRSRDGT
jgi:hypothetical protein